MLLQHISNFNMMLPLFLLFVAVKFCLGTFSEIFMFILIIKPNV